MNRKTFITRAAALTAVTLAAPQKMVSFPIPSAAKNPKIIKDSDGESLFVIGDQMQLKLDATDTDGLFTVIESQSDPGMSIPMHVHKNEDEMFRVLEGQVSITVGGETTILSAGDTAFAPRNIPHSWTNTGDKPLKMILTAVPSGIETMFRELDKLPPGPPDFPKVAAICARYGVSFV
ncbi:MAG: cupin domain-containing protein [Dokdonia sp.]|jgi:quercetin dioxygenase-like cupin family protein|nr:cupin [Cytophagaceae bacterium]